MIERDVTRSNRVFYVMYDMFMCLHSTKILYNDLHPDRNCQTYIINQKFEII